MLFVEHGTLHRDLMHRDLFGHGLTGEQLTHFLHRYQRNGHYKDQYDAYEFFQPCKYKDDQLLRTVNKILISYVLSADFYYFVNIGLKIAFLNQLKITKI